MALCNCGCGQEIPKGRRKFASELCCDRYHNALHNPRKYPDQTPPHVHPCNYGKSKRCWAKKTGLWEAPNPWIRTCPPCTEVKRMAAADCTDEAVMANI